jgi:hypothetical protein
MNVCCSNKEANESEFTDEAIESCKETFINVPVVGKIKKSFKEDDFEGHEVEIKLDENGQPYWNYLEVNIGLVPESANIRIEQDKYSPHQKWIVLDALIWAERSLEVSKIFKRRKSLGISMEVNFDNFEYDEIRKIEVVHKFTALAITILGKSHTPAFKNSMASLASFSEFKTAMCFALNEKSEHPLSDYLDSDDSSKEEVLTSDNQGVNLVDKFEGEKARKEVKMQMDENKMMELFSGIEGYEYIGYSDKAVYGMNSNGVYAFPYQVIEDTVKMEEDEDGKPKGYETSIYAKFAVETMKEEEKVEGVEADVDSENPAGKNKEEIEKFEENFEVGNKYSTYFTKMMESKSVENQEYCNKFSELEAKYSELQQKFEEAENEKNEFCNKYEASQEELKKYKDAEFETSIAAVIGQYEIDDETKNNWLSKSKAYSDVQSFKKDLVFDLVESNKLVKKQEENPVLKYSVNTNTNKKTVNTNDAMEVLRAEFNIAYK